MNRVRCATKEDLGGILAIERVTPDAPHWPESSYAAALHASTASPQRCIWVAELAVSAEARLAGFAAASVLPAASGHASIAELESIAVLQDARRHGLGRALCESAIDWARACGAEVMELEVRARTHGAIALYSHLGFERTGRRLRYYRDPEDDAILMRLRIA